MFVLQPPGVARWVCLRCLANYAPVVDSSGQDNIVQCGELTRRLFRSNSSRHNQREAMHAWTWHDRLLITTNMAARFLHDKFIRRKGPTQRFMQEIRHAALMKPQVAPQSATPSECASKLVATPNGGRTHHQCKAGNKVAVHCQQGHPTASTIRITAANAATV